MRPFFGKGWRRPLAGRDAAFDKPFYRLVYGDSDSLPGMVVDRFGDYLVVQFNNEGIERYREPLLAALVEQLQPRGILLRGDSRSRREQGLAGGAEVVYGEVPEQVPLEENGVRFLAPVHGGQKTGWFYDHRMSRARLAAWVGGKSVLDVYSYIGGWGIQAAAFGASRRVLSGQLRPGAGGGDGQCRAQWLAGQGDNAARLRPRDHGGPALPGAPV